MHALRLTSMRFFAAVAVTLLGVASLGAQVNPYLSTLEELEEKGLRSAPPPPFSLNRVGAPDFMGYQFTDSTEPGGPAYQYVDISVTGALYLLGSNTSTGPIALPAPFPFYGEALDTLVMASNGYISTDPTDAGPDLSNDCPLPSTLSSGGGARIYPLHDNLTMASGEAYYEYFPVAPRPSDTGIAMGCHVFQWVDARHSGEVDLFGFEALLYDNGDIVFQYGPGNPEEGDGSTTGIQNELTSSGLSYACNEGSSIVAGLAIRIFRDDPLERALFSIDGSNPTLRRLSIGDGHTVSAVAITLPGETVLGGNGLSNHPQTGELMGLLRLQGGAGARELVTIDPLTGVATSVGNTGDRFTGLAVGFDGTIHSMSGVGAIGVTPESLCTLSAVDGTPFFMTSDVASGGAQALAYNPDEHLLYHAVGSDSGSPEAFETIHPGTLAVTGIPTAGFNYDGLSALTHFGGAFLLGAEQFGSDFLLHNINGTAGDIGDLDHSSRGLALNTISPNYLYSVSPDDPLLRQVNSATGQTITHTAIILPGARVTGGNGLVTDPLTGELWALLKLDGASSRQLVTLDPTSGLATSIGDTGDDFAGLAFIGLILYGVTGDGAAVSPECLWTLNQTTGAPTYVMPLGNGTAGETIAANPVDGRLYHASGLGTPNAQEIFEGVDPVGMVVSPEVLSGFDYDNLLSLTYQGDGSFLGGDLNQELVTIAMSGEVAWRATMDHNAKGLAFSTLAPPRPLQTTCPTAGTLYGTTTTGAIGPSDLWIIDRDTGSAQFVGDIGFNRVGAIDFDANGTLYGVGRRTTASGESMLITIDPCTGAGFAVGPTGMEALGLGTGISDISFRRADNTLFAHAPFGINHTLLEINTQTGAASLVGSTGLSFNGGNGIAFDPSDALFHANSTDLNTLDQGTGTAVMAATLEFAAPASGVSSRINGMDFEPGTEAIFASVNDGAPGSPVNYLGILSATPPTAEVPIIGPTVPGLDALAFVPHADLQVVKHDSVDPVTTAAPISYTVTLTNNGPTPVSVEVNDPLPSEIIYQSDTPSQGTYNSGTGLWSAGLLPASGGLPLNGGFESRDFRDWTVEVTADPGTVEYQPYRVVSAGAAAGPPPPLTAPGAPAEGEFFAQNGFDGGAGLEYNLYQEVDIPAGATGANLEWRERIQWDLITFGPGTISREYDVTLQPSGGGAPLATLYTTEIGPGTEGDTGYGLHGVDLLVAAPGIAGTTVRLNWRQFIPETNTGPAQFDLDAIDLAIYPSANEALLIINGTVAGTASGTITNVATATSSLLDPDLTNNVATEETVVLAPEIDVVPMSLDFAPRAITAGPSSPQSVVISNVGGDTLYFFSIAVSGSAVADFNDGGAVINPLAAGASREVQVTFDPAGAGNPKVADLLILSSDADESTVAVALSGEVAVDVSDLVAALLGLISDQPSSEFDTSGDGAFDAADVVTEVNNP